MPFVKLLLEFSMLQLKLFLGLKAWALFREEAPKL
jgi:hypothetical protein